jgi:hypothetical protein
MPPLTAVPPLLTVGAAALDRAPEWARLRLFGHAIPAMRLYRGEEPRGYINGRELYGRGAVILVWELPYLLAQTRALWAELPGFYAQLQRHHPRCRRRASTPTSCSPRSRSRGPGAPRPTRTS